VKEVPGLENAVIVAAGHPEWGQVPVVVVEGAAITGLATIRRAVTEQLGRAAAPARLVEVPRMPRLSSGKPDRVGLAEVASETEA
jgi:O-succinylbenzoic acid--CoA ligase